MDEKADAAAKKKARAEIDAVLKQVKAGGDFAKLAQEHSQDGSAAQGGDLNYFAKGQMVPAFDKVAFELKPGQVSGVVTTPVRVSHHQGHRSQAGPDGAVRGSSAADQAVPHRAEEAAARGGLHRGAEEEVQDRGPDLTRRVNEEVLPAAAAALERGEPSALVTIVRANGSTPQRTGAKMLVFADGRTVGTIGGGCYENDALGKAREAIATGKPALVKYDLNDDFVQESGLICGGQMEVYIDPIAPAPVAVRRRRRPRRLAPGAHRRRRRLPPPRRRRPREVRERRALPRRRERSKSTTSAAWLHRAELPPSAYVVVVTRGHTHDFEAVRALAARDLRYLGLIGSRAKVARIFDALEAEGMPLECLPRVHAPIGLDIGAITPAEIAISILAELIADPSRQGRVRVIHEVDAASRSDTLISKHQGTKHKDHVPSAWSLRAVVKPWPASSLKARCPS